jgi:hypothetical protein
MFIPPIPALGTSGHSRRIWAGATTATVAQNATQHPMSTLEIEMMTRKVFPQRVRCHDMGSWVSSPYLANSIWMRIRPKGLTWYCADLEILSPTSVRLFVYDMEDNFHGGIGKMIAERVIEELPPKEQAMLDELVLKIYTQEAKDELIRREERLRQQQIISIRKEMFGV